MDEPEVLTRTSLTAAGASDNDIRHALRAGTLVPLARGVYLRRTEYDALDEAGRHRVHARHVGSLLEPGEAISHVSAAVLHRLDIWKVPLTRVHVSRPARHGRITPHLHAHHTTWGDDDLVDICGVAVTSVARTVVDLARTLPRDQAVATGDSALRLHPNTRLQLAPVLARARHHTGTTAAASVLDFLDGRSESVGESLSRIRMRESGLPAPDLQREVVVRDGRRYRLDFFWDGLGIVGEFDGSIKYRDRRDLLAEKRREDALRDLGLEVVRWNWAELERFEVVAGRFARAVTRARSRIAAAAR
ncbi:hypothetical protein [Rhodococcus sp. 105337]|uniref:hypothetical protein n=1 Tax=Rhodococcus sp. 105337 TaxID=2725310 RepID=UPI00146ECE1B|nr:hypothetical protein [Rhodococcus sp. 105337]NME80313.1 hypothetical protein [Rhodococcus sp. 105337]